MKFYFHEDAELEFDKAIEYYEGCQTGLGLEYTQEIFTDNRNRFITTVRRI